MNAALIHGPASPRARLWPLITLLLALAFLTASPAIAAHEAPAVQTSGLTDPIATNPPATARSQESPLTHLAPVDFAPDSELVSIKTFVDQSAFSTLTSAHPDNFVVCENGVRQNNVNLAVEHAPISIRILL